METLAEQLTMIYKKLFDEMGPQHWWPAESEFEMMIGAILVQNTNWGNVDLALRNLDGDLSPERLDRFSEGEIAERIRPSGFYNQKAKTIQAFLAWYQKYGYQADHVKEQEAGELRRELLGVRGIGRETADCMLTYAFEKPVFIVDAYARRIFERVGLQLPKGYEAFRERLEAALPKEWGIYGEYHALLVELGKAACKKKPQCINCPLREICKTGREILV